MVNVWELRGKIGEQARIILRNAQEEKEDLGTGLTNEKIVIASFSIMSVAQLLEINKICSKILYCRKNNLPIPKIHVKLANPKDYIKAYSDPALDVWKLEKIHYILGRVIQRKQEQKRVKNNAGNVEKEINKQIPL